MKHLIRNHVRKFRFALLAFAALAASFTAKLAAQTSNATAPTKTIAIRVGELIDAKSDKPIPNALIVVQGDRIASVTAGGSPPVGAT